MMAKTVAKKTAAKKTVAKKPTAAKTAKPKAKKNEVETPLLQHGTYAAKDIVQVALSKSKYEGAAPGSSLTVHTVGCSSGCVEAGFSYLGIGIRTVVVDENPDVLFFNLTSFDPEHAVSGAMRYVRKPGEATHSVPCCKHGGRMCALSPPDVLYAPLVIKTDKAVAKGGDADFRSAILRSRPKYFVLFKDGLVKYEDVEDYASGLSSSYRLVVEHVKNCASGAPVPGATTFVFGVHHSRGEDAHQCIKEAFLEMVSHLDKTVLHADAFLGATRCHPLAPRATKTVSAEEALTRVAQYSITIKALIKKAKSEQHWTNDMTLPDADDRVSKAVYAEGGTVNEMATADMYQVLLKTWFDEAVTADAIVDLSKPVDKKNAICRGMLPRVMTKNAAVWAFKHGKFMRAEDIGLLHGLETTRFHFLSTRAGIDVVTSAAVPAVLLALATAAVCSVAEQVRKKKGD
jgi:hypothetical protein